MIWAPHNREVLTCVLGVDSEALRSGPRQESVSSFKEAINSLGLQ